MAGPSLPSLRLRSGHGGAGTTSAAAAVTTKDSKDAAKHSKSGKRHHDAAAAPAAKDRAARDNSKDRAGGKRSKLAAFFLHPGGDHDRSSARDRSAAHSNGNSTTVLSASPPVRATSPLPAPHPSSSALARVRAESVRTASSLSVPASAPHHLTADQSALTLSDDDDLDTDRPTSPVLLDDTQSAAATAADSASTTSSLDAVPPVRRDRAMSLRGFLMDDHRAHPAANPAHHHAAASTPVPRVQLIGSTPTASAVSIASSAASSSAAAGAARSPSALASLRARWSATTTKAARAVKNATKSTKQHKNADPVPLDDDYLVPSYTPMKLVARSPLASSAATRAALEALNLLPDSGSPAATSAPINVPASASAMHRRKSLLQREREGAASAGAVVGSAPTHVPVPMPSPVVDATDPATASDPVTVRNVPTSSPTPVPATPRKTSVASKLKLAASSEKLRRRRRTGSATSTATHPGELSPRPRSATHDVSAPEFQQLANIFGWSLDSGLPNVQSPRTARASSVSAASVKSVASARSVAGSAAAARGSHDAVPPLPILVGSFTGLHDDHTVVVPPTPTVPTMPEGAMETAGHDAHPPPSSIAATVGGVATPPDSAALTPNGGRRHIDDIEWWQHVEVSYKKRASAASTVVSHVPPHRRSTMNGSRTSARASMYSAASGRRSTSDGALVVRSRAGSRAAAADGEGVDASEPVANGIEGGEDAPQVPHLPAHAEADEEVEPVVAAIDPGVQEPAVEPAPAVDADNVPIAEPSGHGSSVGVPLDMAATSPDLSPTADMPTSPLTSTSAADVTEHDDDVDDVQVLTQERRRLDRVAAQRHQSLRRPRSNEQHEPVEPAAAAAVPAEDAVAVEEEEVDVVDPASPLVLLPADLPSPAPVDAREPFPDSPIAAADATTPVVPSSAVLTAIPLPVMGFRVPELETHVDVFAWAQAVAAAEGDEMQSSATALEMVRRLTSEIDYDFLSDFFIVYRMFMDPLHLAKLLVLRVRASVPFPADSDARRVSRFRTFVVLRHWFQNYYEYDFADNKALRRYMGKALKTMTHMPALMATGMDRRQIKAIKRLWISCSEKYNPVNALSYDADSTTTGGALSFATTAASDISPPPSVINVSFPPVPTLPAGEISAHHVATHHLEGGAAKRQQMRSSVWSNTTGTATSVGSGESDGLAPPHTLPVRLNMALLHRSSSVASSTASSSDVYSADPNVTSPAAHLNPTMAARLHRSLSARTDSAVGTSVCPSPVAGVRVSIQSTSGDSAMPLTAVASMYRANGAAAGDAASVMAIMGDYDRVDEEDEDDDEPTTWMHRMAATEAPTPAVAAAALDAQSPPLVATPAVVPTATTAVDHEPHSLRLADVANGTILRVRSPVPPPGPSSALSSPMTSPLADRPVSPLPARLAAPSHLSLDRSMTQSSSTSHGGTLGGNGAGSVHQAPSIMGASSLHAHHAHHHHKDSFRHKIKNVFKPRTESVRSYETESAADISVSAPTPGVASPPAHRPSASSTPPLLTSPLPAALRGLDGKKGVTDAMMQAMASEAMHDMAKSYTHAVGPAANLGRALGFHSGTMPWILRVRSSEVAQHLSIVEQVRVRRVDWTELLEIAVGRHPLARSGSRGMLFGATMARRNADEVGDDEDDEAARHGNVREVIDRFNTTCQWVTSQILSAEDVAVRARAIEKFIKIAAKCAAYSNYSTLMAITLGLQSPYVDRLKRTWAKVHAEKRATLQQLVDLTSPFRNFKDLRAAMEDCATGVPFIGIYLSDLLFNNELPDIIPDRASMASRSAKSGNESDETEDDEMENEALRKRRARAKAVRAARARAERYRRLAHEIAQYHDAQFAAHPRATGSPLIDLEQDLTTLVNWQKYKTMAKVVKQFRAFLEGPTYASTAAWPMRESLFWRLLAVEDEVLPMAELERRSFLYEPSNRRSVGGPLVGGPAPSPAPGTTTSLPRPVPAE